MILSKVICNIHDHGYVSGKENNGEILKANKFLLNNSEQEITNHWTIKPGTFIQKVNRVNFDFIVLQLFDISDLKKINIRTLFAKGIVYFSFDHILKT